MNIMLSAAFAAIVLAGSSGSTQTSAPKLLTIATILAHPSAYDGNLVRIKGAAVVRFEAVYICDKSEMIDSGQSKKCLWLGATEIDRDDINNLHRNLVDMVGRFRAGDHGHMREYGGTISPISAKILGVHGRGDIPPPPSPSSAH